MYAKGHYKLSNNYMKLNDTTIDNHEVIEFAEKERDLTLQQEIDDKNDDYEKETGMKYDMVEDKETGEWQ